MRILGALTIALITAACSTKVPITLNLPTGAVQGTAEAMSYTGTIQAPPCRGEFTGSPTNPTAPLVLSCNDGRQGAGTVELVGGQVSSGTIVLNDGKVATITPGTAPTPKKTTLGSRVPLVRPLIQGASAVRSLSRPAATSAPTAASSTSGQPSASKE
jgi:hypothetical protein